MAMLALMKTHRLIREDHVLVREPGRRRFIICQFGNFKEFIFNILSTVCTREPSALLSATRLEALISNREEVEGVWSTLTGHLFPVARDLHKPTISLWFHEKYSKVKDSNNIQ